MTRRGSRLLLLSAVVAGSVAACGDGGPEGGNMGGAGGSGTGLTGGGLGGASFNECGVAAPLPAGP